MHPPVPLERSRGALALLLALLSLPAWAAERTRVVVVQSADLTAYRSVAAGFGAEVDAEVRTVTVPESAEGASQLWAKIAELDPALIFALGPVAATGAKRFASSSPVVFAMVPYYERYGLEGAHTTGVGLTPDPAASLDALRAFFPRAKRVGILHDPRFSAHAVTDALAAGRARGLTVVPLELSTPAAVERALAGARGNVDAFVMVADRTVSNAAVVKRLLSFSEEEHVPVVALSQTQVKEGATLSVAPSYIALGQQAGRLARRILYDRIDPSAVAVTPPEVLELSVNLTTARKLGSPSSTALELLRYAALKGYSLKVYE